MPDQFTFENARAYAECVQGRLPTNQELKSEAEAILNNRFYKKIHTDKLCP